MTVLRIRKIATLNALYIILYITAMYYHKYGIRLWLEKTFADFLLLFPATVLNLTTYENILLYQFHTSSLCVRVACIIQVFLFLC
jgi:hypothetical protein